MKEELWQIDLSDIDQDQHEAFINRKRGMVRASLSLYNSREDIQRLISALQEIDERIEDLRPLYQALPDGNYRHKNYELNWQQQLDWE